MTSARYFIFYKFKTVISYFIIFVTHRPFFEMWNTPIEARHWLVSIIVLQMVITNSD